MGQSCGSCFSRSHDIPISSSSDPSPQHEYRPPRIKSKQPVDAIPKPVPSKTFSSSSEIGIGPILGKPYFELSTLYVLGKELGRGQFGITRLCTEKATGLQYACKSISRRKLISTKDIEDVRREILILQHVTGQPNIVEFKGAYEDIQNLHLVMEVCSGGELFDRITAKGRYSEKEAARIGRQILNVVHACHFMGVMHRDLKPENFLLVSRDDDAPLKAIDFGLSVFIEEDLENLLAKIGTLVGVSNESTYVDSNESTYVDGTMGQQNQVNSESDKSTRSMIVSLFPLNSNGQNIKLKVELVLHSIMAGSIAHDIYM
ncbi:unnamed protein product [Ilex paraguariensis]|uniref:non-specific serine/threonine protein kinase n=1 Tax=Ilex paraguariensis TaxID=185542 RepID=A0ABC8U9P6_9AQUA